MISTRDLYTYADPSAVGSDTLVCSSPKVLFFRCIVHNEWLYHLMV